MKIGVLGAGAIGCYVGGRLLADGVDVVFVSRERIAREVAESGLTLVDGVSRRTPDAIAAPSSVPIGTDPASLADRDVVLVCVKSGDTTDAGKTLGQLLPRDRRAVVVSLQNGVRNAGMLREQLEAHDVLGGIVGFNVVSQGRGVFRRATTGPLVIEASTDRRVVELGRLLRRARFEVELRADIEARQWSKLVVNLNNAVSALTDVPTARLVVEPGYRRILAAVMGEAIAVMKSAKIRPARVGPLPVRIFPWLLRLPSPLVRALSRVQVSIDPEARSSMWQDLSRRRSTEVDLLNGEIVRLAESCGARAPLNARVVELVHDAERAANGSPRLSASALWNALADQKT